MKVYTKIEDWLNDKPEKDVIERVISTINRNAISQGRKELREKTQELGRVEKTITQMEKIDLPIGPEVKKRVQDLKKTIDELQESLPVSPQAKKAKPE